MHPLAAGRPTCDHSRPLEAAVSPVAKSMTAHRLVGELMNHGPTLARRALRDRLLPWKQEVARLRLRLDDQPLQVVLEPRLGIGISRTF